MNKLSSINFENIELLDVNKFRKQTEKLKGLVEAFKDQGTEENIRETVRATENFLEQVDSSVKDFDSLLNQQTEVLASLEDKEEKKEYFKHLSEELRENLDSREDSEKENTEELKSNLAEVETEVQEWAEGLDRMVLEDKRILREIEDWLELLKELGELIRGKELEPEEVVEEIEALQDEIGERITEWSEVIEDIHIHLEEITGLNIQHKNEANSLKSVNASAMILGFIILVAVLYIYL